MQFTNLLYVQNNIENVIAFEEICHVAKYNEQIIKSKKQWFQISSSSSISSIFNVNIITPTSRGYILRQLFH